MKASHQQAYLLEKRLVALISRQLVLTRDQLVLLFGIHFLNPNKSSRVTNQPSRESSLIIREKNCF